MKTLLHLAALISILFLSGCEKEKPVPPPVDPRNRIVGTYSEIGPEQAWRIEDEYGDYIYYPVTINSGVSISKFGTSDINFGSQYFGKTIRGSLSGSNIMLEMFTCSGTIEDCPISYSVISRITIVGTSINCTYSCSGNIELYEGEYYPLTAAFHTTLYKN